LRARRGISGLLEEFGGYGEGWVGAGIEQAAVLKDVVCDERILEQGALEPRRSSIRCHR
jgi:hypothetical protein